jgi:hypothetical protein
MSDQGLMNAGRKMLEARGQPNAEMTADRVSHGTEGSNAGGSLAGGRKHEVHADAMRAHAAIMAAHSDYMRDAGGAEHGIDSAREGAMHAHEAGQGDEQSLNQHPGSGVGAQRQAFSHAREQGQLGKQKSVPLP